MRQPGRQPAARVSVITVVRNAAATLERTILSVLEQSGPSIEYIIVDGGSTDGTLDILRSYDDRLALWISEPDRGISDAFNKGLALATGEIIGLLNADDAYAPGAVEASVAALDATPDAGFSFGHCQFLEGDKPAFLMKGDPDYARYLSRRLPALSHPTVFVRRWVYERFGLFRSGFKVAMDYDFLLRIHVGGVRGVLVPRTITEMRLGGVSITHPVRGHWEVFQSALEQHQPAVPAAATFAVAATGALGRLALERVGAKRTVDWLRRLRFPTIEQ